MNNEQNKFYNSEDLVLPIDLGLGCHPPVKSH